MQLSVRDAAALLDTSEDQIHRYIKEGLPAHKIGNRYRLNRAELLEWAVARGLPLRRELYAADAGGSAELPAAADALQLGGVHHGVPGGTQEATLRAVVARLPLPEHVDKVALCDFLVAREALGTTAIGDGIAIPHVRNPIVIHGEERPVMSLCFLKEPVDFGALDGKPVFALFTLLCPTIREHLHLLSRLAFLLRDRTFREAVGRASDAATILALARNAEQGVKAQPPR